MRIYVDQHEAHILSIALMNLKAHYPNVYGSDAQKLHDKLYLCAQVQKSGKGVTIDA